MNPFRIADLAVVVVLTLAIAYMLGGLGPGLDERDSADLSDARAQAKATFQRELAFAKACREEHGEALVRQTVDGSFVCVPRHTKQANLLAVTQ